MVPILRLLSKTGYWGLRNERRESNLASILIQLMQTTNLEAQTKILLPMGHDLAYWLSLKKKNAT